MKAVKKYKISVGVLSAMFTPIVLLAVGVSIIGYVVYSLFEYLLKAMTRIKERWMINRLTRYNLKVVYDSNTGKAKIEEDDKHEEPGDEGECAG